MHYSPLKWLGGKSKLVPYIKDIWKDHKEKRFVDLFCGGLSVSLGLKPDKVLANDLNKDLISFWNWIKEDGIVKKYDFINEEEEYYNLRLEFNKKRNPELFYYLNKTCRGGIVRYCSLGFNNTPYGKYEKINYLKDFSSYKEIIKDWEFTNLDFEKVEIGKNDFIYADPPYDNSFDKYTRFGFSWDDQVRLANKLSKCDSYVVVSNKLTERVCKLYDSLGFEIREIVMNRGMGSIKKVKEMLAVKK